MKCESFVVLIWKLTEFFLFPFSRIKTANASKYMESLVKMCYIRIKAATIFFNGENTAIYLFNPKLIICCGASTQNFPNSPKVMKQELKSW